MTLSSDTTDEIATTTATSNGLLEALFLRAVVVGD